MAQRFDELEPLLDALAERVDAAVIEGDDFYDGAIELRSDTPAALLAACIDWKHQRLVLEAVRAGRQAAGTLSTGTPLTGGLAES